MAEDFDSDTIKTLCLCRWSGLQVRHRHNYDFVCRHKGREFIVKAVQIAELLPALSWLDTIPSFPVCISQIGRHRALSPDFSEVGFEKFKIKGTVLLVCGRMGCFIYLAIGNQKNRPFAIKTRLIDKFSES